MNDCIFCKIISGELPCAKVYEDDQIIAFLDIQPTRPGHTLVVPKTHCDSVLDCHSDTLAEMVKVAQKIAPTIMRSTGADGFNLGINTGRSAGQIIFHLHLHIIPRKADDGLRSWGHKDYGAGEMEIVAEGIRGAIELGIRG